MPLGLSPVHLILILVIALIVVGPGKLPEVGGALGKTIKEFRKAASDVQEATTLAPTPAPAPAAPAAGLAPAPMQAAPAPMQAAPVAAPPAPAPPPAPAFEAQLVQPATSPAEAAVASSEAGA